MTAEAMDVDSASQTAVVTKDAVESIVDMDQNNSARAEDAANPEFSKFMQGFWDLANVDVPVRTGAAAMIVRHVAKSDVGGDSTYAVKRLIRGVCSSRDAARQGFASCLAEVLQVLPKDAPPTAVVLEQILEATKTTSAMKGAEERELVLGRLLGISALALSGRLRSDAANAEGALKAATELYGRRKWLGQAAGEACLLVTSKAFQGQGDFAGVALPLLTPLLKGKDGSTLQLSDLSPDQLMLALGLRSMMRARGLDPQEDVNLKHALPPFLRHATVVRSGKAQDLIPVLKQAASVFPKVHSVWGYLWDDIGLAQAGKPRTALSTKRLKRLGEVWSTVVDGALTSTSLNNKGTSVLLLKQLLQRVPAAGVWHVLSPGIVRLMLNHTQGEENYLFSLVKMTLQQLPSVVQDDQEVQGQLAACLLRRGTIRFDTRVGVKVVSSLVGSMGQEALDKHVEFLKGVVQGKPGWAECQDAPPDGTRSAAEGPPLTTSEHAEDLTAERLQAVETLHSLGRGGDWGHVQGERLAKTAEFFLETGFFEPVGEAVPLPPKLLELCRSKFFSLAADIANKPWLTWSPKDKEQEQKHVGGGEERKWEALEALWGLHETWRGLEARGRKLLKGLNVGSDEREACAVALNVAGRIRESEGSKLAYAFAGILLMVSLHLMDGSREDGRGEERCQHILDIVETYGRMSGTKMDQGDGNDEDGDPDPLAMLADVLVAVVAEPSSHSVRGLRDTARRVWGIVCQKRPLTKSALNTLLAAVCGEDSDAAQDDNDDEDIPSSEEDDDDSYKLEEDEDEEEKKAGGGRAIDGKSSGGNYSTGFESDKGEEDDDEVVVDRSDLEALLDGDEADDEDGEGLQHHAGADHALAGLIGLKKSGRKKGAQEAQRQAYQIRLRAMDLLEGLCGRSLQSPHLIGTLLPVLNAIKKLGGSSGLANRNGGEAMALRQRLETLYKHLCKCKPQMAKEASGACGDMPEDLPSRAAQTFSELISMCRKWEKDPPLSSLALEGGLCCLRSLKGRPVGDKAGKGGSGEAAFAAAVASLAAAVGEFFGNKRGGGLAPAQVEEVVRRFPEEMVPVLVAAAMGKVASDFLRTEAFRLMGDVLQRRGQLNPASRETVVANCPAILKALADVLMKTSAAAAASTSEGRDADASANGKLEDTDKDDEKAGKKYNGKNANPPALPPMMKAKRLKPLLACLSVSIKALADGAPRGDGSKVLSGLLSEASALRSALSAVGDASASLPMQLLCESVADELDAIDVGVVEGDEAAGRAEDAVVDETVAVDERSSAKTKKKRRESSDEKVEDGARRPEAAEGGNSARKKKRQSEGGVTGVTSSQQDAAAPPVVDESEGGRGGSKSAKKVKMGKAKRRKILEA